MRKTISLILLGLVCSVGSAWGAESLWDFSTYASTTAPSITASSDNSLSVTSGTDMTLHYYAANSGDAITEKNSAYCLAMGGSPGSSSSGYTSRYFYLDITGSGILTIVNQSDKNVAPSYKLFASSQTDKNYTAATAKGTTGADAYTYEIPITYNSSTPRLYFVFTSKAYITSVKWTPTTMYDVSAVTSTGTTTYGTVSAGSSKLAKDKTTTITASPADGYKVTNWAVDGEGASISPSGASNSLTTTLMMGTANATVTVTFDAKTINYTVNNSLSNVSKTSGAASALELTEYTAVYAAEDGYVLPNDITVTAGGSDITENCIWAITTGTLTIPAEYVTGNINIIVTGIVPPSSGTIYSLTVKKPASNYSVPKNTETNMVSDYATIDGGGAYVGNSHESTDGKAQVKTDGNGTVSFGGNEGYIKITLTYPIKTGDVITFESGSGSNQICFTTTKERSTTYKTTSNTYTCQAVFNNVRTLYIWRSSGNTTYIHSLTITRPHTVTLTADTWASFCPSFNVTIPTDDDNMKVYKGEYNPSTGELAATAVDATKLKAGEGVLLKTTTAGTTSHVFAPTSSADDLEENDLKGTTEITATDRTNYTYYVLANGDYGVGFYRYENANLPANKAYLRVDGAYNSGSNAPGVRIVEATDNATDIKSVETEKEVIKFIQNGQLYIQRDGIVYDALGRVIR